MTSRTSLRRHGILNQLRTLPLQLTQVKNQNSDSHQTTNRICAHPIEVSHLLVQKPSQYCDCPRANVHAGCVLCHETS